MKGKKKKIAIVLLFLIFLGVISPLQSVLSQEDQVGQAVGQALMFILFPGFFPALGAMQQLSETLCGLNLADCIIRAIASWAGTIATTFLNLSHALLNWVISSKFIGVSMTGPDNPFVSDGWTMMRNLANIILVLGLVVIGLGIILGLEEYQAKKTLPVLIAIAILINFTPVICGFVIDFSNVLMSYFLTGGLSAGLPNVVAEGISRIPANNAINALGIASVYLVFGIVGAITFTLYAFLFAARYLFLWIFIMFSPIAFVSRVFPQSKYIKHFFPEFFYWDTWWEKFLQWCVIGIYGGLFIFLANQLMGGMVTSPPSGALSPFGILFGYLLPILLLLIGLFSAWEAWQKGLNAIPGMKQVVDLGTKAAMVAVTAGAGLAAGAVAGGVAGGLAGETAAMQKALTAGRGPLRAAGETLWGGMKGAARGAATSGGREEGMRWARRGVEKIPLVGRAIGGPGVADAEFEEQRKNTRKELEKFPDNNEGNNMLERRVNMWPVTKQDYLNRLEGLALLSERQGNAAEKTIGKHAAQYQASGADINNILAAAPSLAKYFKNDQDNPMTVQEAVNRIEPEVLAKKINKNEVNIYNTNLSVQQRNQVKEVVLAIGEDAQKINRMRNMKIEKRKNFRDSLKDAIFDPPPGTTVPQKAVDNLVKMAGNPAWKI
jgi:hypothetical protein